MATLQIFLSAVSAEFRSYRDALRRDLDRPNVTVKVQEDFIATGSETLDKLDAYIRQCGATIHLVGDMTGALAQPPSVALLRDRYRDFGERLPVVRPFLEAGAPPLSYTQWEAWLTLHHRKMLIIAVPQDGATRDTGYRLDDAQRGAQQEHLARLASVERYPEIHFSNADRLVVEVMRSGLHDMLPPARVARRPVRREPTARDSNRRHLRGYAFNPHLRMPLEPGERNEIVYSIPTEPLYPGPRGALVEVIDHDPASGCFYEPIDLEHPDVIKQDGLPPSEADPKFHQQFVYAIAMTVIELFEQALGRRVFWSGRFDPETYGTSFVQRLRLYPHALRGPHAYYDPWRKAILFGYSHVPADLTPENVYPEGIVFTCLSPQTVARETAVAILDGMYPTLVSDDRRDTLAFRHAFADSVGLLQHFSMPGVLRHAIARPGAVHAISAVFGELAMQLGSAGNVGALRNTIGAYDQTGTRNRRVPDVTHFARATDPLERGAIVVAAIFDAYLAIAERRIADALRDWPSESDVTPAALPPDLTDHLEGEAVRIARQLLTMCVRALDYCPPIDVTAGDFLRAFITADNHTEPRAPADYRTALVDAFRAHGIHPVGFRSLSAEMLAWNPPSEQVKRLIQPVFADSLRLEADRLAVLDDVSAEARHLTLRNWSATFHRRFTALVRSLPVNDREALGELGLVYPVVSDSLSVLPLRATTRTTVGGGRVFVSLVQRHHAKPDSTHGHEGTRLESGSTVVVKFGTWHIEYIVSKKPRPL